MLMPVDFLKSKYGYAMDSRTRGMEFYSGNEILGLDKQKNAAFCTLAFF